MVMVRLGAYMAACMWICGGSASSNMPPDHGVPRPSRPNLLFVLADDLGYNEAGFMNSTRGLVTPHLDALAAEGVVLTCYITAPMCSPARSSLLTGRYITRLGTQANTIAANAPWGLSLNETLLPQLLKAAGYDTAMWGKWHLGMYTEAYMPHRRGFHESLGFLQGEEDAYTHTNIYPNWTGYDWFRDGKIVDARGQWELSLIRDAAVDFITRHTPTTPTSASSTNPSNHAAGQGGSGRVPWFGYVALREVHGPLEVSKYYEDMFRDSACCGGARQCNRTTHENVLGANATLCGMFTAVDDVVGDLVEALVSSKQLNSTVIVWTSDNGAPTGTPLPPHDPAHDGGYSVTRNWPLKGQKGQLWEGGVRVPAVVWSAAIARSAASGTRSPKLYHATDWFPTFAALAGAPVPAGPAAAEDAQGARAALLLDGKDIWDSLLDPGTPSPRTEVLVNANPLPCGAGAPVEGDPARQAQLHQGAAIRIGRYKLVIPDTDKWPRTWPTPSDPVAMYLYVLLHGSWHRALIVR